MTEADNHMEVRAGLKSFIIDKIKESWLSSEENLDAIAEEIIFQVLTSEEELFITCYIEDLDKE